MLKSYLPIVRNIQKELKERKHLEIRLMYVYRSAGKRISRWRKDNKLSLREAEELLGVSKTQINDVEKGRKDPSLLIIRILSIKNVSVLKARISNWT